MAGAGNAREALSTPTGRRSCRVPRRWPLEPRGFRRSKAACNSRGRRTAMQQPSVDNIAANGSRFSSRNRLGGRRSIADFQFGDPLEAKRSEGFPQPAAADHIPAPVHMDDAVRLHFTARRCPAMRFVMERNTVAHADRRTKADQRFGRRENDSGPRLNRDYFFHRVCPLAECLREHASEFGGGAFGAGANAASPRWRKARRPSVRANASPSMNIMGGRRKPGLSRYAPPTPRVDSTGIHRSCKRAI